MIDEALREKLNDRRVVALLLVGLIVVFGGMYVAAHFITGDKVPRGATVAGVEIGGQDAEAARAALAEGLSERAEEPITVTADAQRARISPDQAGLAVDLDASVEQAGGESSWSPGRMWDYFTGGDDFDAVVNVDDKKLHKAIEKFGEKVGVPAREGHIAFEDGKADPRFPREGLEIDRDGAAETISDSYLNTDEVVELPLENTEPKVSKAKVLAAMDEFANPAMSAPVVIELAGENIVLRPEDYSEALAMKAKHGRLVPVLHDKKLLAAIEPKMEKVSLEPKDATVKLVDGEPKVVPGKNGVTFKPKEITDQFLSLLVQRDQNRTLAVESVVDEPDFDTADARNLKIDEVVSSFTTQFPHADYRNTNLGRAAELVSGTVLKPGETFSLNGTVGERTAENGFTKGYIISDGIFEEDFGGGVSQAATTLFNAAFFAGLEDVEHEPHSFYIDRYPVGREATVVWGALDLKFKNDTPYGILIEAWVNPSTPSTYGSMNVRMWSTKYWDISTDVSDRYRITKEKTRYMTGKNCVPNDGYGGFDIDVFRYFRHVGSDELVRKEKMHTRYTPSDSVVCRKRDSNA